MADIQKVNSKTTALKHSEVWRGGVTAPSLSQETKDFGFRVSPKGLHLRFIIKSKGTGYTDVRIIIGVEDFDLVFEEIAHKIPDFAALFAHCTSIAINQNADRRKQSEATSQETITKLKSVSGFLYSNERSFPKKDGVSMRSMRRVVDSAIETLSKLNETQT